MSQAAADGHDTLARLRRGELAGATRLALACGLEQFPPEIFTLADTLEVLDLSGNQLSELPPDLARLHRLRILFCSDNRFTQLPPALGACAQLEMVGFKANPIADVPGAALPPALRWLILTDNRIETLPDEIGRCTRLQKLMLAGNRLRELPPSLAHCTALELLRISANDFATLPPVLDQLPHLTWLAAGGNPWCAGAEAAAGADAQAEAIGWDALTLGPLLGEGASGQIFAAQWQRGDGAVQDVAVKLFKGTVTSDGWPASEHAASIAAGSQAQLIGLLGTVAGHPQGAQGIVMPRVAEGFGNLARPPSFASCTRDVYDDGFAPSPQAAWRLAQGVAAAMTHLHARGVVHGDLYGHNILWDGAQGDALLGDFGAAFVLPTTVDAAPLQARDVRAFGCLLDELMTHCGAPAPLAPWAALRDACLGAADGRPPFSQIVSLLDSLRPA